MGSIDRIRSSESNSRQAQMRPYGHDNANQNRREKSIEVSYSDVRFFEVLDGPLWINQDITNMMRKNMMPATRLTKKLNLRKLKEVSRILWQSIMKIY